jgi:4-amino-4-deoxy-L-arabinose transferase-like glycosyltransferase
MKTLFGMSAWLLHDKLGICGEVTANRLPSALLAGLLVWLVFAMVLELWGFAEAVIAAALVLLLPRALFHAGLACFDAPITTLWFATVYAYWRCLDGRKWPWQIGVVFGLALATKHNAVLLPFALVIHYLVVAVRATPQRRPLALTWHVVRYRWRIAVSLIVLAPLVLFVLWPWLWLDTIDHLKSWLTFHMTHVHYNFEYLGDNWNHPPFPWHVALVTTLFTVPVATLAAAAIGSGVWLARRRDIDRARAPGLLLALSAAASLGPFFLGTTPIFGAEKHWAPALPSICIAAGVGCVWAARTLARWIPERIAIGVVGGAVVLAAATETVTAEPYALTWYNALAGGAPGGADFGMNRQFWGVAARGVLPVIASLPPGPVYTHDASPAWGVYQRDGLLPSGHPDAGGEHRSSDGTWTAPGIATSQAAIVIHERHFNRHDYLIWKAYGTVQPIFVLRSDGVPIVSVYRRPK